MNRLGSTEISSYLLICVTKPQASLWAGVFSLEAVEVTVLFGGTDAIPCFDRLVAAHLIYVQILSHNLLQSSAKLASRSELMRHGDLVLPFIFPVVKVDPFLVLEGQV